MRDHAVPCVYRSFVQGLISLKEARIGSGSRYQEVQHTGIACENAAAYCTPLRPVDIASYDQPLTKAEIAAEEVGGFFGYSVLKNKNIIVIQNNQNSFIH